MEITFESMIEIILTKKEKTKNLLFITLKVYNYYTT